MKIDLDNIYYYFLTYNSKKRKDHITKEFKDYNLIEVNPIGNIGKTKSGATGFSKILDQACINQDKNKPFQPFAIFEDDVKKFRDFPLDIEIPDDTDILYIGLSICGINNSTPEGQYTTVCSNNINDDIIRVHNMLSLHGIIVCSIRGLLTLQKCMLESYFTNTIWDIYTAQIQPYLNVYALKNPLVYQYGKIGGCECATKIDYVDKENIPIPKEWINKNNISILTMNHQNLIQKDFIQIGKSETNSKKIKLYKRYPRDTILTFNHKYKDIFDYKFEDNLLTITRTDENLGWGQDLVAYLSSSNLCNINYLLKDLGPIEKKIHVSWKTKDILDLDFTIIKHGIRQLKELNPEYTFEISDNDDVEKFIKKHISKDDYDLIKDRNIVEKVDLWRLLKIYHEGGFYMDIDRLCNIPFKDIINSEHKCILPMHYDIDFSQDIMISSSKNIIFKVAIDLNLKRRKEGCTDILSLGPITYFHAITKVLLGKQIPRYPSKDNLIKLRSIISNCKYLSTFRETPPYNTLVYRGSNISFDKKNFYDHCGINHWTKNNPNNADNKPYGK